LKKKIIFIALTILLAFLAWFFYVYIKQENTKVLDDFGTMNEKFIENNSSLQKKLDSLTLQVSYTDYKESLEELNLLSEKLNNHIEYIKTQLVLTLENPSDYSKMDETSRSDTFFFTKKGYSSEGQEFVEKVEAYRLGLKILFGEEFPDISESVNSKLNYRDDIDNWLEYNFKEFPLVAVLTRLSSIQTNVDEIKKELLIEVLAQSRN